ncbi:MAG: class I SAM-dependent methyltransferase [Nanoarchaeota archaeon]|nr:class I SAM-dependent methyltransferase [Nanoarchaeota archaeon]
MELQDPLQQRVLGLLEELPKGPLLDAGCGKGQLVNAASLLGFTVTASDIDVTEYKGNESFVAADLNKHLPFEDEKFSIVSCVEVIEHIESPWSLIKEFHRILKPSGILILTTPNITNVFSRLKFLITGTFFCFSKAERDVPAGHINPLPHWEIEHIFEKNGFVVESRTTQNYFQLSGLDTIASRTKRMGTKLAYFFLFPFLCPRDNVLLKGDNLVYVCRKALG